MKKINYYVQKVAYYFMLTFAVLLIIAFILDAIAMRLTLTNVIAVFVSLAIIYAIRLRWKESLKEKKYALDHPAPPQVIVQDTMTAHTVNQGATGQQFAGHGYEQPQPQGFSTPSPSSASTRRMGWD